MPELKHHRSCNPTFAKASKWRLSAIWQFLLLCLAVSDNNSSICRTQDHNVFEHRGTHFFEPLEIPCPAAGENTVLHLQFRMPVIESGDLQYARSRVSLTRTYTGKLPSDIHQNLDKLRTFVFDVDTNSTCEVAGWYTDPQWIRWNAPADCLGSASLEANQFCGMQILRMESEKLVKLFIVVQNWSGHCTDRIIVEAKVEDYFDPSRVTIVKGAECLTPLRVELPCNRTDEGICTTRINAEPDLVNTIVYPKIEIPCPPEGETGALVSFQFRAPQTGNDTAETHVSFGAGYGIGKQMIILCLCL